MNLKRSPDDDSDMNKATTSQKCTLSVLVSLITTNSVLVCSDKAETNSTKKDNTKQPQNVQKELNYKGKGSVKRMAIYL